ncbi:hypothetical protein DICA0_E37456 [Diutina catenulata]
MSTTPTIPQRPKRANAAADHPDLASPVVPTRPQRSESPAIPRRPQRPAPQAHDASEAEEAARDGGASTVSGTAMPIDHEAGSDRASDQPSDQPDEVIPGAFDESGESTAVESGGHASPAIPQRPTSRPVRRRGEEARGEEEATEANGANGADGAQEDGVKEEVNPTKESTEEARGAREGATEETRETHPASHEAALDHATPAPSPSVNRASSTFSEGAIIDAYGDEGSIPLPDDGRGLGASDDFDDDGDKTPGNTENKVTMKHEEDEPNPASDASSFDDDQETVSQDVEDQRDRNALVEEEAGLPGALGAGVAGVAGVAAGIGAAIGLGGGREEEDEEGEGEKERGEEEKEKGEEKGEGEKVESTKDESKPDLGETGESGVAKPGEKADESAGSSAGSATGSAPGSSTGSLGAKTDDSVSVEAKKEAIETKHTDEPTDKPTTAPNIDSDELPEPHTVEEAKEELEEALEKEAPAKEAKDEPKEAPLAKLDSHDSAASAASSVSSHDKPAIPSRPKKPSVPPTRPKKKPSFGESPAASPPKKAAPPPKPKKVGSKIAAFQEMFNQQSAGSPPLGGRPAPTRDLDRDPSELSHTQPAPSGKKLSSDKLDFAKNLKGMMGMGMPLPGMANPEMIRRMTGESTEDEEGASRPAPAAPRRARGPKKRLPKALEEAKSAEPTQKYSVVKQRLWTLSVARAAPQPQMAHRETSESISSFNQGGDEDLGSLHEAKTLVDEEREEGAEGASQQAEDVPHPAEGTSGSTGLTEGTSRSTEDAPGPTEDAPGPTEDASGPITGTSQPQDRPSENSAGHESLTPGLHRGSDVDPLATTPGGPLAAPVARSVPTTISLDSADGAPLQLTNTAAEYLETRSEVSSRHPSDVSSMHAPSEGSLGRAPSDASSIRTMGTQEGIFNTEIRTGRDVPAPRIPPIASPDTPIEVSTAPLDSSPPESPTESPVKPSPLRLSEEPQPFPTGDAQGHPPSPEAS